MFQSKSIKVKMLSGFSIIIILIGLLGVYNYINTNNTVGQTDHIVKRELPSLIANEKIAYTLSNQISSARAYLQTGEETYKTQFIETNELREQYTDQIIEVSAATDTDAFDDVDAWYESMLEEVFDNYDQNHIIAAEANLYQLLPDAENLMAHFEAAAETEENNIKKLGANVIDSSNQNKLIIASITTFLIIVSVVIAAITSRKITVPIREVMQKMKEVTGGKLNGAPLKSHSKDETGQLKTHLNELTAQMRGLLEEVQHVSNEVNDNSKILNVSAREVKIGAEHISTTMEQLAAGSEKQANYATHLSSTVSHFVTTFETTKTNNEKMQQASNNVQDITRTGSDMMDASNEQMQVIDRIFHDAVTKVSTLDAHSKEISALVAVIKDIAKQTNLLALNAAIEAARAGEHGQGFAVVADEVRKLAVQVTNSVSDITDIVENIQSESGIVSNALKDGYQEVEKGTEQTNYTKQNFEKISQYVDEMSNHVKSTKEDTAKIENEINHMYDAFKEIASISESSAASIEETSAQSEETSSTMEEVASQSGKLQKLTETLNEKVRRFEL